VVNLLEDSLVAQRIVYDSVQDAGGITSVNIDKSMLQFMRGARSRYQDALERKRQAAYDLDKRAAMLYQRGRPLTRSKLFLLRKQH